MSCHAQDVLLTLLVPLSTRLLPQTPARSSLATSATRVGSKPASARQAVTAHAPAKKPSPVREPAT